MYNFKYNLQPLIKSELSSQFQIELEVIDDQNKPVIGKTVELKLVKPTNQKIQWIKSNKEPKSGYLNDLINPTNNKPCTWESSYKTEILFSVESEVIDFVFFQDRIFILDKDGNLYENNKKVCSGLKSTRLLIDKKGNFIVFDNKKITQIYPNLSFYKNEIYLTDSIKDVITINDLLIILVSNKLIIYQKNKKIKEIKLISNFDNLVPINNTNILLIKGTDCVEFNITHEKNINGWVLPTTGNNFNLKGNILTFFNENTHISYNLLTKQHKAENLFFLDFFSNNIKENNFYYYCFQKELFCTKFTQTPLEIEFFIPYELNLESINLNIETEDVISIFVWFEDNWIKVFEDCVNLNNSIPVGKQTQKIKISSSLKNSLNLNSIQGLMINGSTNYGAIESSFQILNSEGKSYFKYIVRSFEQPENFLAIIHDKIDP